MAEIVKRIDQIRHEMKALRYLLELHPRGLAEAPPRDDFQMPDSKLIYDALAAAATRADAEEAIGALDLEEVDVESFLRLGGSHYHVYPDLVRERARDLRAGKLVLESGG